MTLRNLIHRIRPGLVRYLEATDLAWPRPLVYTAFGAGTTVALVFGYAWEAFVFALVLMVVVALRMDRERWGQNGSYARAVRARWAKEDANRGR